MIGDTTFWIVLPAVSVAAIALGWILKWVKARIELVSSERIASRRTQDILQEADAQREKMLEEGAEQLQTEKGLFEEELEQRREEIGQLEQQVGNRDDVLRERESVISQAQNANAVKEKSVEDRVMACRELRAEFQQRLERKSETTREELKAQIQESIVNQEKRDAQHVMGRIEEDAQRDAETRASELLVSSLERLPVIQGAEQGLTSIETPTGDMVNRLISREGRYIRILESLLDVELSLEETWEGFGLSSPDPIKREIARATIDRLFRGGRINPGRIEETVKAVTNDVDQKMRTESRAVLQELGIRDMRREASEALGRLLFRYSYGQNMLYHSKEVALLAEMLARQLGADPQAAKRGGLLHDIGKGFALDGKAHVEAGVEVAETWGEDPRVINSIASHHDDVEQNCLEATIVQIADAISGSRPGARRETIASYVERVEKLEGIAEGFEGVDKAFAIYAGRELRILVNAEKVDDTRASGLASEIVKKVEEGLSYPGKIKITVIREVKSSSYTR